MHKRLLILILTISLLVLAGCSKGAAGNDDKNPSNNQGTAIEKNTVQNDNKVEVSTTEIDLMHYITVNFAGFDTIGTASLDIDIDSFVIDNIQSLSFKGDNEKAAYQALYKEDSSPAVILSRILFTNIKVTPDNQLSNGEDVSISFNIDKELIEKYFNVSFDANDVNIKVNGLDLFENSPYIKVPQLYGLTESEARAVLDKSGINYEISIESRQNQKTGVFRLSYEEGSLINKDKTLHVYINDISITVPNWVGKDYKEVAYDPEYDKLRLESRAIAVWDDSPKGTILSQSLPPNSKSEKGAAITIMVSLGKEPEEIFYDGSDIVKVIVSKGKNNVSWEAVVDILLKNDVIPSKEYVKDLFNAGITPPSEGQYKITRKFGQTTGVSTVTELLGQSSGMIGTEIFKVV